MANHVPGTFQLENSKCIDYSFSFIQNALKAKLYQTMTPARVNKEKEYQYNYRKPYFFMYYCLLSQGHVLGLSERYRPIISNWYIRFSFYILYIVTCILGDQRKTIYLSSMQFNVAFLHLILPKCI